MTKPITAEMIAAWRTLQAAAAGAYRLQPEVRAAINVLDNSDFMVPIEDEGLCTYQVGGGYHSPPEYCEAEFDGVTEFCPKHQRIADQERKTEPCPIHPDEPDDAGCGEEADAARMTAGLLGVPLTGAQAPEHNIPHDRSRLEE
jgi:hypothetical protein